MHVIASKETQADDDQQLKTGQGNLLALSETEYESYQHAEFFRGRIFGHSKKFYRGASLLKA
jgi:hypothetical protein